MPKTFLSKHANRSHCHLYRSKFSSNTWNTACQMPCIFLRKWKIELHKIKPTIGYVKMDACLKILNHWKPRTRVLPRKPTKPTRHSKEEKNNQRPQTNIPKGFVSRIKTWLKASLLGSGGRYIEFKGSLGLLARHSLQKGNKQGCEAWQADLGALQHT